jgi:hypothetical protein
MPENPAGLGPTHPVERGVEGEGGVPAIAQPDALLGQAWLTLQTRYAGRLVKVRQGAADRPPITGLLGFANLLRAIWHGARADDPYADWWLTKVDPALSLASANLDDAKAAQAVAIMGAVPPEILSGEVRAELAPLRPESADDRLPAFPPTALHNPS